MLSEDLSKKFYYKIFKTKKRIFLVPSKELKSYQRKILRKYFKENYSYNLMSVKTVAQKHCNQKWLMKLDIKDFFNSITEDQVRNVISVSVKQVDNDIKPLDQKKLVEHIYQNCTLNNKLPIGAPTSPAIANLVLHEFDIKIFWVCNHYNINYSRYVDDLFFSSDKQYLLSLIEIEVVKELKLLGFEINKNKIKYISNNKPQEVLGLLVNNSNPVLNKNKKRFYRAFFYNCLKFIRDNNMIKNEQKILGHLAYIKSVDYKYYRKIITYIENLIYNWKLEKKKYLKKIVKIIKQ